MLEFLAICGALSLGYAFGEIARHIIDRLSARYEAKPAPVEPVAQPAPITDEEFAIVHRWASLNPWYSAMDEHSRALRLEAERIHVELCQTQPSLTLEANLANVTAEMHRRHPEIVPTRQ